MSSTTASHNREQGQVGEFTIVSSVLFVIMCTLQCYDYDNYLSYGCFSNKMLLLDLHLELNVHHGEEKKPVNILYTSTSVIKFIERKYSNRYDE